MEILLYESHDQQPNVTIGANHEEENRKQSENDVMVCF